MDILFFISKLILIFDIHSLLGIKLFDKAIINLEILNGKLMLNDSTMTSKKIGKVTFLDAVIQEKNDKKIVVGGTSPDYLFFTSAGYNLDGEGASYINTYKSGEDNSIGKFINPLSKEKINSIMVSYMLDL